MKKPLAVKLIRSSICGFNQSTHISSVLLFLLFICLTPITVFSLDISQINIIQSDNSGIRFEIEITHPDDYRVTDHQDSTFDIIVPILIGIPPNSSPKVAGSVGQSINTYDFPAGMKHDNSGVLARIVEIQGIRDKKIAVINVYPLIRDGYYNKIELNIDFQSLINMGDQTNNTVDDKIFDAIFKNTIINYNEFKNWPPEHKAAVTRKVSESAFSRASTWYKITTAPEGFTKLTTSDLASVGISLNNLPSDSIHIFYGGGELLPPDNTDPRPSLEEISITIYDGGDGIFNGSDYLIFFAEAASRWQYPLDSYPTFMLNPYTNLNSYWLAVSGDFSSGKRMNLINGAPGGIVDSTITQTRFYKRVEQNNILRLKSDGHVANHYNWYWTDKNQVTFYVNPSNLIPFPATDDSSVIRMKYYSTSSSVFLTVRGVPATAIVSGVGDDYFYSNILQPGELNSVSVTLGSSSNLTYLDFCELNYPGYLEPVNGILDFMVNRFDGSGLLIVNNEFTGTPELFDLTDPENPILITNESVDVSEIRFQLDFQSSSNRRFYLCPSSGFITPVGIEEVVSMNLQSNLAQTDLIVITPQQFASSLSDYVNYRQEQSNINVKVVSFEDIVNQFSFGMYDPLAIRDFLKFTYENYSPPAPSAVLLVGDGCYDIADNLKRGSVNYIPPCIYLLDETSSDDNYVYFGGFGILDSDTSSYYQADRGYDMIISRWPVRNVEEIAAIVNKIKAYESSSTFGAWRSTVTLVSDDDYTDMGSIYEGLDHTIQTKNLQENHLPPEFLRDKIYLWEYPYDAYAQKPEVNAEIVEAINEGTLLINYVGHGNPGTWAHEHVFNKGTDLQKLDNIDKLALFFAASCSIGLFDDPSAEGMAEDLLRQGNSGAIGIISAARVVYSYENAALNRVAYDFLFGNNDLSIGQSLYAAKLYRQYQSGNFPIPKTNDRKYVYFGDPLVRLATPKNKIIFTEYPSEFEALALHQASGEIIDPVDSTIVDFNGTAEIIIFDSELEIVHKGQGDDSLIYSKDGPVIFRGTVPVVGGQFGVSFIVPLDVGFGGTGAKIFAYAHSESSDALGIEDSIEISPDFVTPSDSLGPLITYTFGDRINFVSNDPISVGAPLVITLSDSSGLNLTANAGHRISLTIDNDLENVINLTDLFEYNSGSYTTGKIEYEIDSLAIGNHNFKIKAWDNVNNSSTVEFNAEILGEEKLMISELLNYPNPMEDYTTFAFLLTAPADKVSLEIFALSGRKLFNYEQFSVPADYHKFYLWKGRDNDGDRVATGVYIYKVTAASSGSDETAKSYGKVVVIN